MLSIGIKTTGDLEKENKSVNQQDSNCFPVRGEYAVSFKMEKAYMNDCDVRCDELLHKIAEELGVELDSRLEFYQMFDEYGRTYKVEITSVYDFIKMIVSIRQIRCEFFPYEKK